MILLILEYIEMMQMNLFRKQNRPTDRENKLTVTKRERRIGIS